MYVDKGVKQVQHFEYETLAHLASDGQARDHTKTTHASVPKWTKTPRVATASKETKSSSGQVGKKRGPVGKNEDGGDKKRSKRDTKNQTNTTAEADTQPCRAQ